MAKVGRYPNSGFGVRNDAANGQKLWGQDLGGAIAGGVITYTADGARRIAVASGFTMLAWPTRRS